MTDKKYKIADGVTLSLRGMAFGAGEIILENALDADTIKALVSAKKIVEEKPVAESRSDDKNSDDKKLGKKKCGERNSIFINFNKIAESPITNFILNLGSFIINFVSFILKK